MSHFFISRPVFACVLAILIMLAGALAFVTLPVAQFPHMAPPTITLMVDYSGASAQTIEDAITQPVEQNMVGLDRLLYMNSTSSSEGRMVMRMTFEASVDPDVAQMQVQNRLQLAMPRLPDTVKNQGVRVRKVSDTFLQYYSFYDTTGKLPVEDIADFIASTLVDPLCRIDGVGDATLYGAPYAMRIWLNPNSLRSFSLTPHDVIRAVEAQNDQISVGQVGGLPSVPGQELNVTMLSRSKLENVEQFRNIVVRVNADGSAVRVRDVARVEMGRLSYAISAQYNGQPAVSVGIQLAEGANAVDTSSRVAAFMERMRQYFPPGLDYLIPYDTVPFIQQSIHGVFQTLLEAILLVALVMFVFLQSWRATLIPTLAVPIVLLGTLGVMATLGATINTLSMFGLVLAIGLLVDDAIVVVENTERLIRTEGLSPRKAIEKSMHQITGALIGVAAVLAAVFLPMAFFSGMSGAIYREFSLTIVSAMVLSVFVAVTITPPLCALLLRPGKTGAQQGFFAWFNRRLDSLTISYEGAVAQWIRRRGRVMVIYALMACATLVLLRQMPTSFLPVEDQGVVDINVFLPPGHTRDATLGVLKEIEAYFLNEEKAAVQGVEIRTGIAAGGSRGQNVASGSANLRPWNERKNQALSADAVVRRARAHFAGHPVARILISQPPQVRGLGQASDISLQLEDQGNLGHAVLIAAQRELQEAASRSPLLFNVRTTSLEDIPQLILRVDDLKASMYGIGADALNEDMTAVWGGVYVNDFVDRGRVKRVYVQGDAPWRMHGDDLAFWHFRNAEGQMVPFEAVVMPEWSFGPSQLERFNGVPSVSIQAAPAPGISSGDAMKELERLVEDLPHGIGLEWSGLSFEENRSGGKTGYLYGLSILVVFLCLAALYESWSIPLAVILVVPVGVLGALALSSMRGLYNDVYFQVGILAVIGLAAKNAILIVEFAQELVRRGKKPTQAVIEAARLRLRPIVMTSMAFLLGVLPLTVSRGAGANSQHAIGTGIVGGTFLATLLGVFLVPVFFVVVSHVFRRGQKAQDG
ncbi:MAG: efflux RND transporter permease subunit [Desulfovibrio sp.]|nr:efflux RND transporter permease subunit [Desulfovibrio sp.]